MLFIYRLAPNTRSCSLSCLAAYTQTLLTNCLFLSSTSALFFLYSLQAAIQVSFVTLSFLLHCHFRVMSAACVKRFCTRYFNCLGSTSAANVMHHEIKLATYMIWCHFIDVCHHTCLCDFRLNLSMKLRLFSYHGDLTHGFPPCIMLLFLC